ncbi:hypothetical protein BK816_08985 [Boudabousia tangfeifanii]|uniref:Membrane protein insertase YidC n=2 Tax=Boudabousia tangfeifanii TaxID=1912795 RepID=A0A1D9MN46_9ACTO|nr:hypothetical protein BK816_08985 [Boudabousia tangfeifanii]
MVIIHKALTLVGFPTGAGVAWILSIILLTVAVRFAIFPLFTKQIRSQRAMQALQPELKKLQARYKGKNDPVSRQNMQQEMMALYKEHGTSPFASCLPILVQLPIITALFRVLAATAGLETGAYPRASIGPLGKTFAMEINRTEFLGVNMIQTFSSVTSTHDKIVIGGMILVMVLTQFLVMRQITVKNMPASALEGPQAQMQKTMMYVMPLMIGFTGFLFQVGLLFYMLTTNFFTMFQQIWAINAMPTPGSEAYAKWHKKQTAKYDAFRAKTMEEYEEKISKAALESPEAVKELEDERAEVLLNQRIKLGLEDKKKLEAKMAAVEEPQVRIQPTRKPRSQRKGNNQAIPGATRDESGNMRSDEDIMANDGEEGLTEDEIARRRYLRRAEQRARKAELRKQKQKQRQERLRQQGKRPGDLEMN